MTSRRAIGVQRRRLAGEAGFTLIELLVVLAVIGLMAAWGVPQLIQVLNRIRLTTAAQEVGILMNKARLDAIKHGASAEVVYQTAGGSPIGDESIFAFVDQNGDGAYTAGTDSVSAGPYALPKGVSLWGPTDSVAEGTHAIADWDEGATPNDGPIYDSDGSARSTGAFRLRDTRGNYLEVRILFAGTGKPVVRKWFGGSDADSNWYENGDPDHPWSW
jgi:prepilin-type N-terminal cleavage/methylation domain-containing protein